MIYFLACQNQKKKLYMPLKNSFIKLNFNFFKEELCFLNYKEKKKKERKKLTLSFQRRVESTR